MGKSFIRALVFMALLSLSVFIYAFISEVGIGHPVLYFLLTIALFFKILKVLFEWYHYAGVPGKKTITIFPVTSNCYTVDMLTTACPGEPFGMIENTLRSMVAVRYPHKTYLCDEGDDPALRQLCEDLGVIHITRNTHENAKAGNINNALNTSSGEICVILDPDHAPFPDFLDKLIHHFDDPKVGYVQIVQAYNNQVETFVARAAAEQTYMFYGPYMRAMGKYGTAQAIGANCTFRREALDSIGGHAPGLTEDMHTSMLLHAKGWESVYVSEILSRGLVPTSLSAYYSQQLKWSRGTFDLWINLFPKLFKKFSWKQKIQYGLMPIYYLFGLIAVIDIIVPVYSLITGEYPWLIDPLIFFIYFIPFVVCSLLVRLYAQRWLHDSHEKGLHLFGGILRVGSWWVYIIGFMYTLMNIKVPYIPTLKEHTSKNEFLLGLPNLIVAVISVAASFYGLYKDWQPYSFVMAGFAISNAIIFFLAFAIGQSRWVFAIRNLWKDWKETKLISRIDFSYHNLSKLSVPIIIIMLIASSSFFVPNPFNSTVDQVLGEGEEKVLNKNLGGFYTGIYIPSADESKGLGDLLKTEQETQHSWSIVSTYLSWGDHQIPMEYWQSIIDHGAIPMITWEPFTNLFSQYQDHPEIANNRNFFRHMIEGCFDDYIDQMALNLRSLDAPVFLRFAHEMDNPMYPWSTTGGNTPEEFKKAWRYLHNRFDALGVQNVSWVWSPWSTAGMEEYFPYGEQNTINQYVDWIGLTALNYGLAGSKPESRSFQEIYQPFNKKIKELSLELPVMLAEFGSTSYGEDAALWNDNSLKEIRSHHPEIKSVILFQNNIDKNWITDWRPNKRVELIDWTFDLSAISASLDTFGNPLSLGLKGKQTVSLPSHNKSIKGDYGNFTWLVDGKDFYLKGICYNPGHDWHDGFYPLTRKQLEEDFKRIKKMGANTIRRYEPGIYDSNILQVAEEFDLKVMYGFWFDPAVDYYSDQQKVKAYEEKVLNYVEKYKDEKSIIAWNIGNETWGLLKKYYAKPYLNLTRRSYLEFLESLAQKIHAIDSQRPVFTSEEHDHYRLLSTVHDFSRYAPSIDVLGINSYYQENIQDVKELVSQFDTLRPYVVTEFGPKGYWSHEFGDFYGDSLITEVSSVSKAKWYAKQWNEYIAPNNGYNLGGFAFSWRDRYEGTATWFGISDYKGRLKPAYYYLQKAWKGGTIEEDYFADVSIVGQWYPIEAGETLWLAAGITNGFEGKLSYEWELFEEGSWDRSSPVVKTLISKQFAEIRMPDKKSRYRIYLYATDEMGNVVSASRPLLFK